MARRLFLHVGTMKSATTYLQGMCDENTETLAEHGLLWLGARANFSAISDLFDPATAGTTPVLSWPQLVERVNAHPGDALVSNELLSTRGRKRVERLTADIEGEVVVVITARDIARVVVSQWQERARNRAGQSWSGFMAALSSDQAADDPELEWFRRRQDLVAMSAKFGAVVGPANVRVVTVPKPGSSPSILGKRFFAALDLPDLPVLPGPAGANPSLGAHSVELMRRLQERLSDEERDRMRRAMKFVLTRQVLAGRRDAEPALGLAPSQVKWAQRFAAEQVQGLKDLGVDIFGDLEDLIPGDHGGAQGTDPAATTEAELLDAAIDAIIGLVGAVDTLASRLPPDGSRWSIDGGDVDDADEH